MNISLPFNLDSVVNNLDSVIDDIGSVIDTVGSGIGTNIGALISDLQKQNIKSLFQTIKDSVDIPLVDIDFSDFRSTVKNAWSDRTITTNEFTAIVDDVLGIVDTAGLTPPEIRLIFYGVQEIAEASRLPKSHDELTGTAGNNALWGGLGKDQLTGVTLESVGVGEIDTLFGGSGKDRFVLGDEAIAYYDDELAATPGLEDYAILLDFNLNKDKIQLHGEATDYTLGALPEALAITGTGIYYNKPSTPGTPELIGVVMGANLTDFNTGFTFV